jgi:hypothetical protein
MSTIHQLLSFTPLDSIYCCYGKKSIIFQLWCYEEKFLDTFKEAINLYYDKLEKAPLEIKYFIDVTISSLILKPSDILYISKGISDNQNSQFKFLNIFVRHHLTEESLLVALGSNVNVLSNLPYDLGWVEVPLLKYSNYVLDSSHSKQLEIKDILPMGINWSKSTSASILRKAIEEGKLSTNATSELFNQ